MPYQGTIQSLIVPIHSLKIFVSLCVCMYVCVVVVCMRPGFGGLGGWQRLPFDFKVIAPGLKKPGIGARSPEYLAMNPTGTIRNNLWRQPTTR